MATQAAQIPVKRRLDKILLVGERESGKRTLAYRCIYGNVPKEIPYWNPDCFKNGRMTSSEGEEVELDIIPLRPPGCVGGLGDFTGEPDQWLFYPQTSFFLLCFSVLDRSTFDMIQERWGPEIQFFLGRRKRWPGQDVRKAAEGYMNAVKEGCKGMKGAPVLLVGCQSDLREQGKGEVTKEEHWRRRLEQLVTGNVRRLLEMEWMRCSRRV